MSPGLDFRGLGLAAATIVFTLSGVKAHGGYDEAALRQAEASYVGTTSRIFNEVVLPAMTLEEEQRLGPIPSVDFPLRAERPGADSPVYFQVDARRRAIIMPIASLKFLDDISTAYAWLQVNGYGVETVSEYAAMLRHAKEPTGGFPLPLQALSIPADALDDEAVADLALGNFVTARTFLLARELAHVLYGHSPDTVEEALENEREADRFAFRLILRTPLTPIGVLPLFMVDAHWSHYQENSRPTHPTSGARVKAAANWVEDPALAGQLVELGELMDDPDVRHGYVQAGEASDFAALAPRRPDERSSVSSFPGEPPRQGEAVFEGRYAGHFTQQPDPAPIRVELVLDRTGDSVTGWYSFGLGIGQIEGTVSGNRLDFGWEWAGNYGRGVLLAGDANSFEGTWGYRDAARGAGAWFGRR